LPLPNRRWQRCSPRGSPRRSCLSCKLAEVEQTQRLADAQYAAAAIDARIKTCEMLLEYKTLAAADPEKAAAAWDALVERWTVAGQVAMLKPLTPEQLAASAMRATGALDAQEASAAAAIDNKPPEDLAQAADDDKPRIRTQLVELKLLEALGGTFNEFVRHFGGQARRGFSGDRQPSPVLRQRKRD
jgi:hypothetical protein